MAVHSREADSPVTVVSCLVLLDICVMTVELLSVYKLLVSSSQVHLATKHEAQVALSKSVSFRDLDLPVFFFFFFELQGKCPSSVHTEAPDEPDLSRNNGLGKACLDDQSTASHPHNGGK